MAAFDLGVFERASSGLYLSFCNFAIAKRCALPRDLISSIAFSIGSMVVEL